MPRYRLTVAYDGTDFKGWQKQHPPGADPLRTVQGEVEAAVRATVREPATLIGASRTDRGVHALGQVAAFTSEAELEPESMRRALNSRLADDVLIRDVRVVDETFSPISQAREKQYRYTIAHGEKLAVPRPLFDRRTVTFAPEPLDAAAMDAAAAHLVGTHDFAGFTKRHHGRESTVRTVTGCGVTPTGPWRLRIDVRGDGFLWNMVRIIAGTLLDVGRGRIAADDLPAILASVDRTRAGTTLPPEGLCLLWIRYDGDPAAETLAASAESAGDGLDAAMGAPVAGAANDGESGPHGSGAGGGAVAIAPEASP